MARSSPMDHQQKHPPNLFKSISLFVRLLEPLINPPAPQDLDAPPAQERRRSAPPAEKESRGGDQDPEEDGWLRQGDFVPLLPRPPPAQWYDIEDGDELHRQLLAMHRSVEEAWETKDLRRRVARRKDRIRELLWRMSYKVFDEIKVLERNDFSLESLSFTSREHWRRPIRLSLTLEMMEELRRLILDDESIEGEEDYQQRQQQEQEGQQQPGYVTAVQSLICPTINSLLDWAAGKEDILCSSPSSSASSSFSSADDEQRPMSIERAGETFHVSPGKKRKRADERKEREDSLQRSAQNLLWELAVMEPTADLRLRLAERETDIRTALGFMELYTDRCVGPAQRRRGNPAASRAPSSSQVEAEEDLQVLEEILKRLRGLICEDGDRRD